MRFLLAALLLPSVARANLPLQTEDAYVAEKGHWEVESAWDQQRWANEDKDDLFLITNNYGVASRLELSIDTPYLVHSSNGGKETSGNGDVNLVAKIQLFPEENGHPAFLVRTSAKMSNGDAGRGLGTGTIDYASSLVVSRDLGFAVFHAQGGLVLIQPHTVERAQTLHFFGVAADWKLADKLRWVMELNGARRVARDGGPDPLTAFTGLVFRATENDAIDVGARRGLSISSPRWQPTVGYYHSF
jgi:hypothetical protein